MLDLLRYFLITFSLFYAPWSIAQCPDPDFSLSLNACIRQSIDLEVINQNDSSVYFWDFCSGDLDSIQNTNPILNNSLFTRARSLRIIRNNDLWYGFAISQTSSKLIRLDFGDSLANIPEITDIGNPGNSLNGPYGFNMTFDNNSVLHAFIANTLSDNIVRLSFIDGIYNPPSVQDLGDLGGTIDRPNNIEIIRDNGEWYVFVSDGSSDNEIIQLNFGSDLFNNNPLTSQHPVAGANTLRGISMLKECNIWKGIITSYANDKLFSVEFNNGIDSSPQINEIIFPGTTFRFPASIKLLNEGSIYYAYIQGALGQLYKINFGSDLSDFSGSAHDLGNLDTWGQNFALEIVMENSRWFGFNFDLDASNLVRFDFYNPCEVSYANYNGLNPPLIHYSDSGKFNITLKEQDQNGNIGYKVKSIEVSSDTAEVISFVSDEICLSQTINFEGIGDSSFITSWSWDFGDTGTGSGQTVSHQYADAGAYPVTLSVEAENGCSNFTRDTVNIYDPPRPDFTITDTLFCSNQTLSLQNQTAYSSPDSITSFLWDINGEATSYQKDTVYTFASGGDKSITLTASIPGCTSDTTRTFNIIEGPAVDFSFQNVCDTEPASFINNSTGDISEYNWDFGDGYVSSLESPDHLYDTTGTYEVKLLVSNDTGCVNQRIDSITVHHLPQVDFSYELPCSENEIGFYDESTVPLANITSRDWFYGRQTNPAFQGTDTVQNPSFTFPEPGEYEVSLVAFSNYGCTDTVQKVVNALPSPEVDFDFVPGCLGDTIHFSDLSTMTGEETLDSWTWQMDQQMYFMQEPGHVFTQPGEYEINLTVEASNRCENRAARTMTIDPLPEADFYSENQCLNEPVFFASTATSPPDPILNYVWHIEGADEKTGPEISHLFNEAGDYGIMHSVITEKGCRDSVSQTITVYTPPKASFDYHPKFGAIPFEVSFENNSTLADGYQWEFDDGNETSNEANPVHIYEETGTYEPQLIARNQWGCEDSTSVIINVVLPVLDVRITNIRSEVVNGKSIYVLQITNTGTVIIDDMDILISIDGEYTVSESFKDTLYANGSVTYPLDFGLFNLPNQQPDFICFELIPHLTGYEELNTYENRECLSRENQYFIRNVYPNPARDQVQMDIMLPEKDEITLQLLSRDGRTMWTRNVEDTKTGLNQLQFDMGENPQGMYFLRIFYRDNISVKRINIIR